MSEFEFGFEELPLIVDLGFDAGLVNGSATIRYHADGEWFIGQITLDGHRRRTDAERLAWMADATPERPKAPLCTFECKPVPLDEKSWLYLAIYDQLENGRFKIDVEDAVQKALEEDREDGAPRPRTDREEHSTLNRAQQGV